MKELIIKRSEWLRGGRDGTGEQCDPELLNSDGHKCCLGFYLLSCGLDEDTILHNGSPEELGQDVPEEARWLVITNEEELMNEDGDYTDSDLTYDNSAVCSRLMSENDLDAQTDKQREKNIAEDFAKMGVKVIFVD